MARVQKVIAAAGQADNTAPAILVVPMGHKYEILEASVAHNPNAAILLLEFAAIGGVGLATYQIPAVENTLNASLIKHTSLCLNAGDTYFLAVFASGATWSYAVTYMDVTS